MGIRQHEIYLPFSAFLQAIWEPRYLCAKSWCISVRGQKQRQVLSSASCHLPAEGSRHSSDTICHYHDPEANSYTRSLHSACGKQGGSSACWGLLRVISKGTSDGTTNSRRALGQQDLLFQKEPSCFLQCLKLAARSLYTLLMLSSGTSLHTVAMGTSQATVAEDLGGFSFT